MGKNKNPFRTVSSQTNTKSLSSDCVQQLWQIPQRVQEVQHELQSIQRDVTYSKNNKHIRVSLTPSKFQFLKKTQKNVDYNSSANLAIESSRRSRLEELRISAEKSKRKINLSLLEENCRKRPRIEWPEDLVNRELTCSKFVEATGDFESEMFHVLGEQPEMTRDLRFSDDETQETSEILEMDDLNEEIKNQEFIYLQNASAAQIEVERNETRTNQNQNKVYLNRIVSEKNLEHLTEEMEYPTSNLPMATETENSFIIYVIDQNHPENILSFADFETFRSAAVMEIRTTSVDTWPHFETSYYNNGIFVIVASNQEAKDWMYNRFHNIIRRSKLSIKLTDVNPLTKDVKASVQIKEEIHDPINILRSLHYFNPSLDTIRWRIINHKIMHFDKKVKTILVVRFSDSQAKALEDLDDKPFYNLGRIKFRVFRKNGDKAKKLKKRKKRDYGF